LKRLLKNDLEIRVLGFHLTVQRIVMIAVLVCLLVLAILMVSELVGDEVGEPPEDPDTGRYEESDPNWPLCTVFIFLALVLLYFILVEIKR
jgi:Na+-transporting methylmalonyl-CoA/oxaloacetate decarboxylase gamma subunit